MRVLALGIGLPDAQVDNYDWASALSFYDYDAMVVDPAVAVSKLIDGVIKRGESFVTYTDDPVESGPGSAETVGLTDLLRRRQEEAERHLARGGLVVCFAYPDLAHPDVPGFNGCHRYYWLPAPAGADYSTRYVKPANGVHVQVTDYEHPFADYLERLRNNVLYRAAFAEGAAGFGEAAKVIGRSPGGAAIALDVAVGGGRVIFIPALPQRISDSERSAIAHALVTAIRNTLLISAEDDPPDWIDGYTLPGLEDAEQRIENYEAQLDEIEEQADEARNEYRSLDRFRRLLWQEGKYGFDLPVRDALVKLGFINFSQPDDPATFLYDSDYVFLETEASEDVVGMEPHYRLRQRLETRIASEGRTAKGLIVVNGYRNLSPPERARQYDDSLRIAAESMRYCVVEATRLFDAVKTQMDGGDVTEFLQRLTQTEGAYTDPITDETLATPAPD
ncbi:MAG TPA: hypothetical protein VJB57_12560 [Dehalococcoidia bacterium]|nr:hypothetical protein [Dehalococcoidia bacterium]